jgi:hypothetical protein
MHNTRTDLTGGGAILSSLGAQDMSYYSGILSADNAANAANPGSVSAGAISTAGIMEDVGKGASVLGGTASAIGMVMQGNQSGNAFVGGMEGLQGASTLISTLKNVGVAIPGPVGAAIDIGATLIGALGSKTTPAEMPDVYNTQAYGQGLANLQGVAGANGLQFQEDPAISQATGGQTELQFIEEQLAKGKPSWMTTSEYQSYVGMFGSSASGSGHIQFGKNIDNQNVVGAAGVNGMVQNYQTLDSFAAQFMEGYEGANSGPLAPLISVNALGAGPGYQPNAYNTPGMALSAQQAMFKNYSSSVATPYVYNTQTPGVGTTNIASTTASVNSPGYLSGGGLFGTNGTQQPITINLTLNGSQLAQVTTAITTQNGYNTGKMAA